MQAFDHRLVVRFPSFEKHCLISNNSRSLEFAERSFTIHSSHRMTLKTTSINVGRQVFGNTEERYAAPIMKDEGG